VKLEYTDIIVAPFITEKSTELKDQQKVLCFKVHAQANKVMVKEAVETLFKTQVDTVRIMNFQGKEKRYGRFSGRRPGWKKAYVKLKPGAKMIEYFEVV
jgi:large subunit ribosomal protein L23